MRLVLMLASLFVFAPLAAGEPQQPTLGFQLPEQIPQEKEDELQPKDQKSPPEKETLPEPEPTAPTPPETAQTDRTDSPFDSGLDLSNFQVTRAPEMLGDLAPFGVAVVGPRGRAIVLPSARSFKVADNSSPRPQDRVFFSFNYYDDLYASANRRLGNGVEDIHLARETFGVEKTFFNGRTSLAIRLPVNSAYADQLLGPDTLSNDTDIGDVSVILRAALYADPERDNWFTVGLGISTPTGPDTLIEVDTIDPLFATDIPHATTLQPFTGVLFHAGRFYFQGFTAIDISTDPQDTTYLFNDYGVGYFLYQNRKSCAFLTALSGTSEVHVTTPLDNRGEISLAQPIAASDIVNLTIATNFEFRHKARLALGVATPVTGPTPFDVEALLQFRLGY